MAEDQAIALADARDDVVLSRISRMEAELAAMRARLAAMDKAVALLEKFPTAIDVAVGNLERLHGEKFENVIIRFHELNTRLTEGDRYKQTALDAALKAAETLVNMQQLNNKESIRKTEELFARQIENVTKTADNLKASVNESSGGWKALAAVAALLLSVGALIVTILRH